MGERIMKKRFCVLQVTPAEPNPEHVKLFDQKENCDFYFVTHDKYNEKALKFCPNTTWTDTRNILMEMVPKNYDYYAFMDYDYKLHPKGNLDILEQIIHDLDKFNPAVLTCYPGEGLITPFAKDEEYYSKYDYSIIPFTHCGLKIIHKSLINWFFPMLTKFGGGVEACHLFNILEIPYMKHVVCSHKIIYDNGTTDMESPHNKNPRLSKLNMDKMWAWIYPYFNKRKVLRDDEVARRWGDSIPSRIEEYTSYTDSLKIKDFYVKICKHKIKPKQSKKDVDYTSEEFLQNINKFFDLEHEYFTNKQKKSKNDIIVIVGNGPSLKEEYFDILRSDKVDTFGLNVAYRFFDKMNWYPDYYGCFDYAATNTHKENISKMILDENCPIKKYFMIERPSIETRLHDTKLFFSDKVRNHTKFVERPHNQDGIGWPTYGTKNLKISCTGANAIRTALELGYKKIILIGHDATYVQSHEFKEHEQSGPGRYLVKQKSDNPNYFWKDYYEGGDVYNKPGDPLPAWQRVAACVKQTYPEIDIVNCSKNSRVTYFRFGDFFEELGDNK